MDTRPTSKIVAFVFIVLISLAGAELCAAGKQQVVTRRWVVKLKQNSWLNKRPFQFASPVSDGETLFVGVHRGIFYAVHERKGKKIWNFTTQGAIYAAAAIHQEWVIVPDAKGFVYCLDKKNGTVRWMTQVGAEVMSKPLVWEDKIYIMTLKNELFAIRFSDGLILWKRQKEPRNSSFTVKGSSDPVLVDGKILVGYSDGTLVAHDPKNGISLWSRQLGEQRREFHDVDTTLLVADSQSFITSADGKLFSLDPKTGNVLWQAAVGGANDAAKVDELLYVTANGVVYCFEATSGQILWEQDLQVADLSSPAIYGKWLAVVATQGKLYFLDRQSGDIAYSHVVKGGGFSDPLLEGKNLYILSNGSRLYLFEFQNS